MEDQSSEQLKAFEMLKGTYEDGEAEINNRVYQLTKTTHKQRRKIFAFFSKHQSQILKTDFSFLETDEFKKIEEIINNLVMFQGDLLSRLPDHWEKYPEDYIIFVSTMLGAMSYPFFQGVVGD